MKPEKETEIDYNITYARLNPAHNTPMGVIGPLLEVQKAEIARLREFILYLIDRTAVEADPKLVEITSYIQPFALASAGPAGKD